MKKLSKFEKIIALTFAYLGFFWQMVWVIFGLFLADSPSYARSALPETLISALLFLGYILLLIIHKKISRMWAWSLFALLITVVIFLTYLQDALY